MKHVQLLHMYQLINPCCMHPLQFNLVPLLQWIGLLPEHAMVLELSREGKVIRSLHDKGGTLTSATSQILELGDTLLIGSYKAPYIIRVKL